VGFSFFQEFEARTRFFSSMIFSGIAGFFIVFIALVLLYPNSEDQVFLRSIILIYVAFLILVLIVRYEKLQNTNDEAKSQLYKNRLFLLLLVIVFLSTAYFLILAHQESLYIFFDLLCLFSLSFFIFFTFGYNMSRVRIQEQQALTGLYLAYLQSVKSQEPEKWRFRVRRQSP